MRIVTHAALVLSALAFPSGTIRAQETPGTPEVVVDGLKNPESVCIGPDGRIYVSVIGNPERDGDGAVLVIEEGKAESFAGKLNDPKGLATGKRHLYVADKKRVLKIDMKGKVQVLADAAAFPQAPKFLNDVAVDEKENVYVSDSGDFQGATGAVFQIDPKGKVSVVLDSKNLPTI